MQQHIRLVSIDQRVGGKGVQSERQMLQKKGANLLERALVLPTEAFSFPMVVVCRFRWRLLSSMQC